MTGAAFCILLSNSFNTPIKASAEGVAEIAMELDRGNVLYGKNVDTKLPMASTTKIMTALIICEDCNLDEVITINKEAVGVEGSSIYLKQDEQISVKDLLYGLMLVSGNDAACALALHHSNSIESFIEKMNERALELGADNTHFNNPNGLPDEKHYTTARDLCNITRTALKNQTFAEIVSTKRYSGQFRCFTNKNKLLTTLEGANGVKTGYTEKAGRCLVSSAKRDNMDVVCVVLNCYDMFERSAEIINNCFNSYSVESLDGNLIFNYEGKSYSLKQDYCITVEKNKNLIYRIKASDNNNEQTKLEIYCEKDLIFCENLFTIN